VMPVQLVCGRLFVQCYVFAPLYIVNRWLCIEQNINFSWILVEKLSFLNHSQRISLHQVFCYHNCLLVMVLDPLNCLRILGSLAVRMGLNCTQCSVNANKLRRWTTHTRIHDVLIISSKPHCSQCPTQVRQNFSAALAATVRSLPLTFDAGLPETQIPEYTIFKRLTLL